MTREVLLSGWMKKRRVMRRYDSTAYMYDMRYRGEQEAEYRAALKHLEVKNDFVLDVGCGTGLLFNHVSADASMVCGIDFSRKTLDQAKRRARDFDNVHVVLADADHLPLRKGGVTLVFAFTLAQNVPNPVVTLQEARNIVRDDAVVVFSGLKRVFSLEDFRKLLFEAGLKIKFLEQDGLQCYVAVCEFVH
jgi:ubiquinone/menaquinone biosynthesis C-methylase UbiE